MAKRNSPAPRPRRPSARRRRTCYFCDNTIRYIDYRNPNLRNFLTERGKIVSSKLSGTCARHQRMLARAIKVARSLALLPYTAQ